MKLLSFLGVLASIAMLVLMYLFYLPLLDSPASKMSDRFILGATLLLQLYLLFFALYIALKIGAFIQWESEKE